MMDIETLKRYGTIALVVTALVSVMVGVRSCYVADVWEDRVVSTQAAADSALERAREIAEVSEALKQEAARLAARADRLETTSDSLADEVRLDNSDVERRMVETRLSTPADLVDHPSIVDRDHLIDDLYEDVRTWEIAYDTQGQANDELRASNMVLNMANDSLSSALWIATAAADSLNAVLDDRPGRGRWWLPELGLGPSIGVAADGTAYTGVGVNLSWKLPIG